MPEIRRQSLDEVLFGEPPAPAASKGGFFTPEPEPMPNNTMEPDDEVRAIAVIDSHEQVELDVFAKVSKMPPLEEYNVSVDLNPDWVDWQVNVPLRFYYLGIKNVKKKQGGMLVDLPVVVLQTSRGEVRIDAGYKLRDTLSQMEPPCAVEITYIGDKRTGNGMNMKDFSICMLSIR